MLEKAQRLLAQQGFPPGGPAGESTRAVRPAAPRAGVAGSPEAIGWCGCWQVIAGKRYSQDQNKPTASASLAIGCYATSLALDERDAAAVLAAIRGRWSAIENGTHYRRDVSFGEDDCRTTNRQGAAVLASLVGQFLLLGIDADDGITAAEEFGSLAVEDLELLIAQRTALAQALAVGVQGIADFLQQMPNGMGTDAQTQLRQFRTDPAQSLASPQTPSAHGIAGGVLSQQGLEPIQDFGRFFSTAGRPPPRLPHPAPQHLAAEQFVFAMGDRGHIQTKSLGRPLLTATAMLQALQSGVKPPLLFIQHAVKEGLGVSMGFSPAQVPLSGMAKSKKQQTGFPGAIEDSKTHGIAAPGTVK